MLTIAYILNFLGMIVLPIGLWFYFTRKFALPWKLVLAGALTFIASQVLHVPLVFAMNPFLQSASLIVNAVLLGLLAGIFEETARYILFKYILKNVRSWKEGVLVGLGHGGIEAILLGILAAVGFVTMIGLRTTDLATLPDVPAAQLELLRQQVTEYWAAPWYTALLGFVERVFAICLHVSLSVMVLYAIAYGKAIWFWLALLWHAFVDAVVVYFVQQTDMLTIEGIIGIFAIISVWIVFKVRSMFFQNSIRDSEGEAVEA